MGRYIRKTKWFNGKKYEATGKTEMEAMTKLAEKIAAAKRGEETEKGGGKTVNQWFDEWFEVYQMPKKLQASTARNQRGVYLNHIAPFIGGKKLRDVRAVHLQKCLNELAGQSYGLIEKVHILMHGMFSRARIDRIIPFDPSEDLIIPAGTKGTRRSLTDVETDALLKAADATGHGLWIRTLLYTGMRPGEVSALRWSSVDFTNNEIHVTVAREADSGRVKAPKTEAGIRDIPIHSELRPLLLAAKGSPFDLVFTHSRGGMVREVTIKRWFREIHEIAEEISPGVLGSDVTAYTLRHTFCTNLQKAGVAINVAKCLMGHSNIQVTANIYTHSDAETLHKGMALLDGSAAVADLYPSASGGNGGGNP